MESSTSVLIGLVGALVGGFITGSYQFVYDWRTRPKLELDYLNETGSNITESSVSQAGKLFSARYIRVRLRNIGSRPAKQCLVFLTAIEEVHPSGVTSAPYHDAMPLSWPDRDFSPRVVPHGVDFYVDVAMVLKGESGWNIRVEKLFGNQEKLKNYRGTYRFKLLATADNAEPKKFAIDITYDGDWHNLRALKA